MRILQTGADVARELEDRLQWCTSARWSIAWAGAHFPAYNSLLKYRGKLKQLTVGIHFYQTNPEFLENFVRDKVARWVMNPSGVFHPKVYYFERSAMEWCCVIGSPNFTNAAFATNTEVATVIENSDAGATAARAELLTALDQHHAIGEMIEPASLKAYRAAWNRQKPKLAALSGLYGAPEAKLHLSASPLKSSLFVMDWASYYAAIDASPLQQTNGRVVVLREARKLFRAYEHFDKMPEDARAAIGGFRATSTIDWCWFGSMIPAGHFKHAVLENSPGLSRALDEIPLAGEVTARHFAHFAEHYMTAGPTTGIGGATRLLAMKRPDTFLCLNSRNQSKLREAFDLSADVKLDTYWSEVVMRLMDADWWNAPPPTDALERGVWDGRAAFLDVLFYEPKV